MQNSKILGNHKLSVTPYKYKKNIKNTNTNGQFYESNICIVYHLIPSYFLHRLNVVYTPYLKHPVLTSCFKTTFTLFFQWFCVRYVLHRMGIPSDKQKYIYILGNVSTWRPLPIGRDDRMGCTRKSKTD
jgi:hypothetical protein